MTSRPADDNPYPPEQTVRAVRGYRERMTTAGIKVIEIDFTADPAKDNAAWMEERKRELGEAMFRREMLRDWTVASGDAFYPEFALNGGVDTFVFRAKGIVRGIPIGRGWDFGARNPAVTWSQRVGQRAIYYRELMLFGVSTYVTADLVRFLSGQIRDVEMMAEAQVVYATMLDEGKIVPGPWFPPMTVFEDYAGPECFRTSATVKDGDPRSDYEVLAGKGIVLSAPRMEVMDRVKVVRKLLYLPADRRPNLLIDDRCPYLIGMLNGGLGYESTTPGNPYPMKPRKDGKFDNIHDAASYWAVQVFPLVDMGNRIRTVSVRGVPTQVADDGYEYLALHETRGYRGLKVH